MTCTLKAIRTATSLALLGALTAHAGTVATLNYQIDQFQVQVSGLDGQSLAIPVDAVKWSNDAGTWVPASSASQLRYFAAPWGAAGQPINPDNVTLVPVSGTILPAAPATLNSADGVSQSTFTPNSYQTSMTVSSDMVAAGNQTIVKTNDDMRWVSEAGMTAGSYPAGSVGDGEGWMFTLPAQSRIQLSGVAQLGLDMDVPTLQGMLGSFATAADRRSLAIDNGLRMSISPVQEYSFGGVPQGGYIDFSAEIAYDFDAMGAERMVGESASSHHTRSFMMDVVNDSDEAVTYVLDMHIWQEAVVASNGRLPEGYPWVTPPGLTTDGVASSTVPEPATYALMGLGLVGLAAVTRRRHAQA
ncbi:MAG: hypothetical protein RI907_2656 [Pseudomonadota bacterium]